MEATTSGHQNRDPKTHQLNPKPPYRTFEVLGPLWVLWAQKAQYPLIMAYIGNDIRILNMT